MLPNSFVKIIKLSNEIVDLAPVPLLITNVDNHVNINKNLIKLMSYIPDEYVAISKTHEYLDVECKMVENDDLTYMCNGLEVKINNFLNTDDECVGDLKKIIFDKVIELSNTMYNSDGWSLTLQMSKIQKYQNGDFLGMHNHKHSEAHDTLLKQWSGSYYISDGTPDTDKPYSGVLTFHIGDENNNVEHHIKPMPGMLLIWPSDVIHHVNPFFGKSDRVMICFNVISKKL